MKILHTSDWHLGRQFHGQSLQDSHAACLEQVYQAIVAHGPDVLIVAGDIYDRAAPPAFAVRQFNDFMQRVYGETETAIVLIAGNHDSGDRVAANGALVDRRRVLIRGPVAAEEPPLILNDAHGPVVFSALPFANEYAARECFADPSIAAPADTLAAQVAAARAQVPKGARWVVTAHGFVASAKACESERALVVGGVETVPLDLFAGVDYVALGHLHRPQALDGGRIRYSGAPLAFGFDEGEGAKSMALVELDADGSVQTELLPFHPLRGVRTIRGEFADILAQGQAAPSDDYLKVILTNRAPEIDAMGQLRTVYPNALALEYAWEADEAKILTAGDGPETLDDPQTVIADFLTFALDGEPDDADHELVRETLTRLVCEGDD